ncbi:glycosyltransferase family A protein [Pseudooceanicola aestuarii]|uniref:glycosyltransferase family A protein n=1 Tax=Pseudooceanicola aestuarii TaxID=2697319 RepID=UPI0013D6FA9A|nr:glycosyltransferase family A protein [Pseudooceanicola aestuarii]
MSQHTVITLSTIPPRFDRLGAALDSLLAQTLPASEIRLYIPDSYRRFRDWDGTLPALPDGVTIHRCDKDFGPATKVLPAARDLRGRDVDILFCDDDKVYDPEWHQRFKDARAAHPDACIVEAGETFPDIADSSRPSDRLPRAHRRKRDWRYRSVRALTLTLYKPFMYVNSGFVDQISGYGGVMLRPEWLDDAAFEIPDVLWTVDDPWISGHLERAGVPIWLNAGGKRPGDLQYGHSHSLQKLVEQGHDRVKADVAAIDYFRDAYNIWKPTSGPHDGLDLLKLRNSTASMFALAQRARDRASSTETSVPGE